MELIAAVLLAGPLGYLGPTRRQGLGLYLLAWAVIFPMQTIVVPQTEDSDDPVVLYYLVNAAVLALGVALNSLGARLRARGFHTAT
jgi:hypothetical protein